MVPGNCNYVGALLDFPGGSDGKASVYNAGDPGSIPGLGRSPGEGNDNPLQDYCLENPTDWGAWWATAHGVAKSRTGLSKVTIVFAQFTHVTACTSTSFLFSGEILFLWSSIFHLFIHQLIDIWVFYTFWLLWIYLLWRLVYKFFFLSTSFQFFGEGNGNPLQYSCLENAIDWGAWQATVHGVAKVGHNLALNHH